MVLECATANSGPGDDSGTTPSNAIFELQVAIAESMGGGAEDLIHPERLFVTGYAGCFHCGLRSVDPPSR